MLNAMSRVRESAHMLQAEHRGFPDQFNAFDRCEVASMQRWADEASICMQRALGEQQQHPVPAKAIEWFLEKCIGVQTIIVGMPPTVDTIDSLERMRSTIERLRTALHFLSCSGDPRMTYTFRRDDSF